MNLPAITTRESLPRPTAWTTRNWTYEEILAIFDDGDGSLVNPLVRRCQALEAALQQMQLERDMLALNRDRESHVFVVMDGDQVAGVVWPASQSPTQQMIRFPAAANQVTGERCQVSEKTPVPAPTDT